MLYIQCVKAVQDQHCHCHKKIISNVLNSKLFDVAWNSSWTQHCTVLGRCS